MNVNAHGHGAQVYKWRMTELWGFPFCFLVKLWVGLRDPHENWTRNASRVALLFTLPGLMDHFPSDYAGKLQMAIEHHMTAEASGRSLHKNT